MDTETMRYYYVSGLWPMERLDKLLAAGKITREQYDEITEEATDEQAHQDHPAQRD